MSGFYNSHIILLNGEKNVEPNALIFNSTGNKRINFLFENFMKHVPVKNR